jgi:hypothetical protein
VDRNKLAFEKEPIMAIFGGQTSNKIVCRVEDWMQSRELLGANWYRARHLVLAGPDAGDIRVIRALNGIGYIEGYEYNSDYRQQCLDSLCKLKLKNVNIYGDVTQLTNTKENTFRSISLDWCGMVPTYLEKSIQVIQHDWLSDKGSVITLGFSYGRGVTFQHLDEGISLNPNDLPMAIGHAVERRLQKEKEFHFGLRLAGVRSYQASESGGGTNMVYLKFAMHYYGRVHRQHYLLGVENLLSDGHEKMFEGVFGAKAPAAKAAMAYFCEHETGRWAALKAHHTMGTYR